MTTGSPITRRPGDWGRLRATALTCLALVLTTAPAVAQQGPGGRRMLDADQRMAQLTTQLDLDDAQAEQLRPIVEEQTKRQQALFESYSGDRETMRAEMTKLRDETDEQFARVLSEEQMKKYRELRQQRMRQGRPPGRGG